MIAYSSMTVREAIDTIMDRVSLYETKTKLDGKTVWKFLNNARREVFARVIPFKDQAFVKSVSLSNGSALPMDFTRVIRVIANDGSGNWNECRQAKAQEWWRVSNTARPHTINQGSPRSPVFCLWGDLTTGTRVANTINTTNTAPLSATSPDRDKIFFWIYPTLTAQMEYSASYSDLPVDANNDFVDTARINIPYEYENLCILMTLWRCYGKIAETDSLIATYQQVAKEEQRLQKVFMAKRQTEAIDIQSLVSPEPSATIPTTINQ